MSGLTNEGLRLLRELMDMPSLLVLGALEGTLWLDELEEVRELEGPSVVALMKSPYTGDTFIDVICRGRCGRKVLEVVFPYIQSVERAWVSPSDPSLVDALISSGVRLGESLTFYVMRTDGASFRPSPPPPGFSFTALDEHDLEAASSLLAGWDEVKGAQASDMVMRGNSYGAWAGERLVGIVGTYATTPDWWYLGNLFVDPEFRGRGVGRYLASLATAEALNSAREAYATVEYDNSVSRGLLARLGYRAHAVSTVVEVRKAS